MTEVCQVVELALFVYTHGTPQAVEARIKELSGVSDTWVTSARGVILVYIENGFDGFEVAQRIRTIPSVDDVHIS